MGKRSQALNFVEFLYSQEHSQSSGVHEGMQGSHHRGSQEAEKAGKYVREKEICPYDRESSWWVTEAA